MSLGDIAARLGVSKPTVWAWEHGKSRPVERRLSALAEALGVTPAGLEPAVTGPPEEIERSRLRIAQAYGVEPMRVRIMIELWRTPLCKRTCTILRNDKRHSWLTNRIFCV